MNLFDVYPLFNINPVKAQGSYIWDDKGNKYLDMYGGHAVISIGHSHPHYVSRISSQLQQIGFYSNAVLIPLQQELAKKLGESSGYAGYNLFLCNSGAEANENALKLASFHNGRKKIITFKNSFHGRTSLAVASTDNKQISAPVNEHSNIVFLDLNDESQIEKHIDKNTCAVIIEGIQGVGGVYLPSKTFLQKLRSLCTSAGALLIVDEVQSGYGRTGKFFAHQHSEIKADIITIAKGMGNGFPVAGVIIHPDIKATPGMLGTTFGGNYLACAAAIAVLDIIEQEELVKNAAVIGNYIAEQTSGLPGVKEVRHMGLMIGIEFQSNCTEKRKALLFDHKIFTGSASDKNTLRLLPALNIGKQEADTFIHALQIELSKQPLA
jgi:acetylornithine aminotransferase